MALGCRWAVSHRSTKGISGRCNDWSIASEPALVSEHLGVVCPRRALLSDLLPFLARRTLCSVLTDRIDRMQSLLGRRVAIENPTHYIDIVGHSFSETDFLRELVARTGCALLLDLNNVWISARNLRTIRRPIWRNIRCHRSPKFIWPATADPQLGESLLIDSHDQPVSEAVWALHRQVLAVTGPIPTMIERDGNLSSFDELLAERDQRAHGHLREATPATTSDLLRANEEAVTC